MRSFVWNNVFCVIRVTENSYHRILEEIKVLNTILPGLRFLKSWALWATTVSLLRDFNLFNLFFCVLITQFLQLLHRITNVNKYFTWEVVTKDIKIWIPRELPVSPFALPGISKTMVSQSVTYRIGMFKRKILRGVDAFMLHM